MYIIDYKWKFFDITSQDEHNPKMNNVKVSKEGC